MLIEVRGLKLNKKFEIDLIFGYILLSYGIISAGYSIITIMIYLPLASLGIVVVAKDMTFDLVFMFIGYILIKKKKHKKYHQYQLE